MRCTLLFTGLAFAALPAGSALAATTVGQTGDPLTSGFVSEFSEDVQTDAAMPTAGTVTSLQTQAGTCNTPVGVVQGTYDLQVLRPLGGDQYKVLGDTGNETDPCNGQLNSYPVTIAVQAGDLIGAYTVSAWEGVLSATSGSINGEAFVAQPAVGDTLTTTLNPTGTLDESATLVPTATTTYAIVAFGQPINDPMNPMSVFKHGSTVPVKFQLTDQNGNLLDDADATAIAAHCQATISVTYGSASTGAVDETGNTATANSGSCFRYDPTSHQFIYNLGTKELATGTWTITATVTGSFAATHSISAGLR